MLSKWIPIFRFKWAGARLNQQNYMGARGDQSLRCPPEEGLGP